MRVRGADVQVIAVPYDSGLLAAIAAAGHQCPVASGAITAYDPGYDSDGRIAATAIDVALALSDAAALSSPT